MPWHPNISEFTKLIWFRNYFQNKLLTVQSLEMRGLCLSLDEMTQQNASKFAIFYIGMRKPKVAFSIFHFVLLNVFP